MALAHFGQSAHVLLEFAQGAFGLALEADHREDRDRKAELGRVEIGVVAADHPVLLEPPHAAQARRRGQPDTLGEFDIGDTPFRLQFRQQTAVDIVEIGHVV